MAMNVKIIKYEPGEYLELKPLMLSEMGQLKNGILVFHLSGVEFDRSVIERYHRQMLFYRLSTVFQPYLKSGIGENRVFGKPNPLLEISISASKKIHAVRSPNPGWFMVDVASCSAVDLSNTEKYGKEVFFEVFMSRCAAKRLIPSNGIFIDLFESWNYFSKQPVEPIKIDHTKRTEGQRMLSEECKIDCSTNAIVEHVLKCERGI